MKSVSIEYTPEAYTGDDIQITIRAKPGYSLAAEDLMQRLEEVLSFYNGGDECQNTIK